MLKQNLQYLFSKETNRLKYTQAFPQNPVELAEMGEEIPFLYVKQISELFNLPINHLSERNLEEIEACKSRPIKLLILDVDGVMTDGGMYVSEQGDETKKFHTKDGMAIKNLTKKGLKVGIISNGFNVKLIERRAELLGIKYVEMGSRKKTEVLDEWLRKMHIQERDIAYIGDDINDIEIMKRVGLTACPADAMPVIKDMAHIVLQNKGGKCAVREFCDIYLNPVFTD